MGAIAGAYWGESALKHAAAGRLYAGLENGKWGRDWALGLGETLGEFRVV